MVEITGIPFIMMKWRGSIIRNIRLMIALKAILEVVSLWLIGSNKMLCSSCSISNYVLIEV